MVPMRLCCARCGAGLVPAWSGLRCPRMAACGYGGLVESSALVRLVPSATSGRAPA